MKEGGLHPPQAQALLLAGFAQEGHMRGGQAEGQIKDSETQVPWDRSI